MADQDPITPPEDTPPEITIETVVETPIADLSDDQKTYLQEHAEDLTDEQKETFKDVITPKPEPPLNPDDIEPEIRGGKKKEEKVVTPPAKNEDDDGGIDPEDEVTIGKVVDKKIGDKLNKLQEIENRTEISSYVGDHPEYAKYQGVALKYMNHPAYANIPVQNIMAIVANKDLMKMGAEKERAAAKKVDDTHTPGGTAREPAKGKVDWSTASDEEFAAQHAKALGQQG